MASALWRGRRDDLDALWGNLKQNGLLGSEFQGDGVLGCADLDLEFAPVRG